jgi:hypothetical protein
VRAFLEKEKPMRLRHVLLAAAVGLWIVAGCGKEESSSSPPAGSSTPPQNTGAAAGSPQPAAPVTPAPVAAPAAPAATPAAPAIAALTDAQKAAAQAAAAAKEQGGKLLTDLETAVKNKNWIDAQAIIKKLDDMGNNLPPDLKPRFDALKKQVTDQAKNLMNSLPGLGL